MLRLIPHCSPRIWGGDKLKILRNIAWPESEGVPLGETWEISTHPNGPSKVSSGQDLFTALGEKSLPFLVKYIDTSDNLSVQVHPNNQMAKNHGHHSGKNECWLILEAGPGAGIYLGTRSGVTKQDFQELLKRGEENIAQLLNFIPVKKGDFFFVPAGTIHAIGKRVTLLEIQEPSDITYRLWDWNRLDNEGRPRTLHLEKGLEASIFPSSGSYDLDGEGQDELSPLFNIFKSGSSETAFNDFKGFKINFIALEERESWGLSLEKNEVVTITNLGPPIFCEKKSNITDEWITSEVKNYESIVVPPNGKISKYRIRSVVPGICVLIYAKI